jgi:hypothetical protein
MILLPLDESARTPAAPACMDAALTAALTIAGDADSPFAALPAYDLRQRMAALIAREAAAGVDDVDLLKASALRGLAATLPSAHNPS